IEGNVTYSAMAPPANVANYIYNKAKRNFRPLYSIARVPVVRPDGSIFDTPGYDAMTRLLYMPSPRFEQLKLPDAPTQDDAHTAANYVWRFFQDFPFEDEASRANMLALILTSVIRPAIVGCVPLALIDAPQPGSGKGLLAKVVALIATGKTAGMATLVPTDEEMRKKITSILVESRPLVCFDNVASMIYHDSLAAVLTADTWSDRLLGANKHLSIPNRATWMATGNNIQL